VTLSSAPPKTLTAKAGGPYDNVVRTQLVTLDGSQSTPGEYPIDKYAWSWTPSADCGNVTLASSGETGESVTIEPLCSLNITLTVTDQRGNIATDTTTLTVIARGGEFATTTPNYEPDPNRRPPSGWREPLINYDSLIAGSLLSYCERNEPDNSICPAPQNGTYNGPNSGYTIEPVQDRNGNQIGPFDGFSYIATTKLEYHTVGVFNPYLLPGGDPPSGACLKTETCVNFYTENTKKHIDMAGWLDALHEHEGGGTAGCPLCGHAGAISQFATTSAGNVNQLLEPLFDQSASSLANTADQRIRDTNTLAFEFSKDPRPVIWGPSPVMLWSLAGQKWKKCTGWTVGGVSKLLCP
jgi:hypothetical protein